MCHMSTYASLRSIEGFPSCSQSLGRYFGVTFFLAPQHDNKGCSICVAIQMVTPLPIPLSDDGMGDM